MARQVIDTAGTDDTLQSGFQKVNANFLELYTALGTEIIALAPVVNDEAVANTLKDTGLEFAVVAGNVYEFRFEVAYNAAISSTGSRWVLDGPTFDALNGRAMYPLTATTQTLNHWGDYNVPAASNTSSLTSGNLMIMQGIIKPNADGTLKLRFASEVSGSAITMLPGSFGRLIVKVPAT